jgi:hypothetical protein
MRMHREYSFHASTSSWFSCAGVPASRTAGVRSMSVSELCCGCASGASQWSGEITVQPGAKRRMITREDTLLATIVSGSCVDEFGLCWDDCYLAEWFLGV